MFKNLLEFLGRMKSSENPFVDVNQEDVKKKIAAFILERHDTASNIHTTTVVDRFPNVGRVYYTEYTAEEADDLTAEIPEEVEREKDSNEMEEEEGDEGEDDDENDFYYTILTEDTKRLIHCDDGIRLLKEVRVILDRRRSFIQMISDFHLYELITFSVTILFVFAFLISLFYYFRDNSYFDNSLTAMFLIILGFYLGKEISYYSGTLARSRLQSEVLATLNLSPKEVSLDFKRVLPRFLGVSIFYIEFTLPGEETEYRYAVVDPEGVELYEVAEEVLLDLRGAFMKRKRFLLRFEELGLFELATALVAILLSLSFLIFIWLKANPPAELVDAMNLVIGYFFAKNASTTIK